MASISIWKPDRTYFRLSWSLVLTNWKPYKWVQDLNGPVLGCPVPAAVFKQSLYAPGLPPQHYVIYQKSLKDLGMKTWLFLSTWCVEVLASVRNQSNTWCRPSRTDCLLIPEQNNNSFYDWYSGNSKTSCRESWSMGIYCHTLDGNQLVQLRGLSTICSMIQSASRP
jgi:hypothetical protein